MNLFKSKKSTNDLLQEVSSEINTLQSDIKEMKAESIQWRNDIKEMKEIGNAILNQLNQFNSELEELKVRGDNREYLRSIKTSSIS